MFCADSVLYLILFLLFLNIPFSGPPPVSLPCYVILPGGPEVPAAVPVLKICVTVKYQHAFLLRISYEARHRILGRHLLAHTFAVY